MKVKSKIFKVLILTIVLFIISVVFIILNGDTYTIKRNILPGPNGIDKWDIEIEDESIIKCVDKKIKKDVVEFKIESIAEGKTFITISNSENDNSRLYSIYVHKFGVISFNEYMGNSNGSIIIPISITLLLTYILFLLIITYKKNVKENMYQYKNIAYLGLIVFVLFATISQIKALFNYSGLINTINEIINMYSFSMILLPVTFVISILVIISNISLIRKEGFNIRNFLGIILGTLLCFSTILPDIIYNALYSATWIDVHNQNGIGLYIYNVVEAIIHVAIAYIECILIGTIIMGIKAARHIPTFDKDAIVILGCQIKKDGSLTNLLKGRVDRAIEFSKLQKEKTNKDIIFVPSGGQGSDEIISESQAIKNYLLEQGIEEENIYIEDQSKNTYENIRFSYNIIKEKIENAKIAFSTTNYHVFRAGCIATEQSCIMEGIGAKTKSYFWINAFIREFIATIFNEKKKHIAVIISIIFATILMILITYLNNNI